MAVVGVSMESVARHQISDSSTTRKHPLAECEKCPYWTRGGFVPTLNPKPSSGIAVIGEAPGAYEAAYGIPFTGPSGDLLNQVLQHHDIQRSEIMITNICLCRPDGNEDPPKAAVAACAPRLHAELAASDVDTIVAVGKVAAHALLDDNKSTMRKLRVGPKKSYKYSPAVGVIPTWHPAYCLRSPDSFPDFVFDFGKIKDNGIRDWTEPEFRVYDDPITAKSVVEELGNRFDRFVLDIECGVDKDASFVHPSEYPLLCLGIAFAPKKAVVLGENAVNSPGFGDVLRPILQRAKIIAHNGKFDLAGLRSLVGPQSLWFDTMLASNCIDERPGHHGLKALSIEKLGAPDYEQAIKKFIPRSGNYGDIPRSILYKYNAYDVVCTWALMELFLGEMSEEDLKKHDFLISAANTLIDLELAGLTFDLEYNKELYMQFTHELDELEGKLCQLVGYTINPRSVPQVMAYYAKQGLILPTTSADFLKELCEKIDGEPLEFTKQLMNHRRRAKLFGTYVKGLAKRVSPDGKVYTTYLLHGTTSGRLSSRDPNLQNVVREKSIRNQFTASSPDNVLVQLDYKQAEGRVIATLAQDEYLRGIFANADRDIFTEICNDVFGVGNHGKEERVKIKSVFYGLAYGREAASIAKELDITFEEAKKLLNDFRNLIPGVMAWQARIKHEVLDGRDLTTPFGRRRSFWLITDRNRKDVINEALSFLPQSIASDICLRALINVQPMLAGIATMRLTIHDALVFECTRDNVDAAASLVRTEMLKSATEFTDYVPFAVDQTVGFRWGML
jgi:uracil-DNA glycosylase family 4